MELKAKQIAEVLDGRVDGDPEVSVKTFARIESGKPGAICFFANPKYEKYVYTSNASVILVNETFEPKQPVAATLVRVKDAYSAVAALLDYVTAQKKAYKRYRGRHSVIKWSSKLGKKVYVGEQCYIGAHTKVGSYTKLYPQVYIGDNVTIGEYCIFYPGVKIASGSVIGNHVILQPGVVIGGEGFGFAPLPDGSYKKIAHMGNVIIEDDVEIQANTTVDRSQMGSTLIRKGAKIDNLCQIAHNVEIGEHTVLCAQTGIAGSTKIGNYCTLAGQSGIVGHLQVADHTTVAAKSSVIKSITEEGQILQGNPGFDHSEFLRAYVRFRQSGKDNKK